MVQAKLYHKEIQEMEAGQVLKMVYMLSLQFVCHIDLNVESAQI